MSAKLCFAENTIKIVSSAEHSSYVSQIVKPPFEAPSQNGTFETKKCDLGFSPVPAETPIFVVFGDFVWAQGKDHFPKTDSCNEMRAFSYLPNTNRVYLFSKKCHFHNKVLFP